MQMQYGVISVIFFSCQIFLYFANGNSLGVSMCMGNQTVRLEVSTGYGDDITCQCQAGPPSDPFIREDYIHTPGVGSHKLHTLAKPWNEARKICNEEDAHLAIINSKAEAEVLLNIFRRERQNIHQAASKEQAFLGIHDLYREGEWVTIFGESLYTTGFAQWSSTCWGPQPDNHRNRQHCGTLVLRCGELDDVYCDASHAFFCELPISCL